MTILLASQSSQADTTQSMRPYVGPRPFGPDDASLFFGRTREAAELLALVQAQGVVVVFGGSGAGKSSLVGAGLIPLLLADAADVPTIVRFQSPAGDGSELRENPFVRAVVEAVAPAGKDLNGLSIANALVARPRPTTRRGSPSLRVLLLDQVERIFAPGGDRAAEQRLLIEQLREAIEDDPLLRVVLIVREDSVSELDGLATSVPGGLRTRFRVERLRRNRAIAAITQPAQVAGYTFRPDAADKLVEDLLRVRLRTVAGKIEVAGEHVDPLQLQVCCALAWRALKAGSTEIGIEQVDAVGEVDGAIAAYLDQALGRAADPPREQADLRRWLGSALVKAGNPVTCTAQSAIDAGIAEGALASLEEDGIVRRERTGAGDWIELIHERFVAPVAEAATLVVAAPPVAQSSPAAEKRETPELRIVTGNGGEDQGLPRSDLLFAAPRAAVRGEDDDEPRLVRRRVRWTTLIVPVSLAIVLICALAWAYKEHMAAVAEEQANIQKSRLASGVPPRTDNGSTKPRPPAGNGKAHKGSPVTASAPVSQPAPTNLKPKPPTEAPGGMSASPSATERDASLLLAQAARQEREGRRTEAAVSYDSVGRLYARTGDHNRAATYFDRAHRMRQAATPLVTPRPGTKPTPPTQAAASPSTSAGRVQVAREVAVAEQMATRGEYLAAVGRLKEVRDAARARHDRAGEAAASAAIGRLYSARGWHADAVGYLRTAAELDRSGGNRAGRAETLAALASAYLAQKDAERAVDSWNLAAMLWHAAGKPARERSLLLHAAKELRAAGQESRAADFERRAGG